MKNVNICEVFCKAKSEHQINEDGYVITPSFIAVVDGATSKNNLISDGLTGGAKLKNIIIDTIKAFNGKETSTEAVLTIQSNILACADINLFGPSAASAIIFSINREEVWSIGDCRMLLDNTKYYFEKKIDKKTASLRSKAVQALLLQGYTIEQLLKKDLAREEILPLLSKQYELENIDSEYGYCVFNNRTSISDFPIHMVPVISVSDANCLILASDGYPELLPSLEESEEYLQKVVHEDPLCYRLYPSTKGIVNGNSGFDDRTYIKIQINGGCEKSITPKCKKDQGFK